jgi:hypothetical protein
MFEKSNIMNSRVYVLTVKVEKAEEALKQIRKGKEEQRKEGREHI